jgi:cell wall-associated NlpC family hydrolase
MITVAAIIAAARACLDTPFRHQGRIPGVALDCAGLLIAVAQAVGADYADVPAYGLNPAGGMLGSALDAQPCLEPVPLSQCQPGDILMMRFAAEPQHLAMLAGDTIIHAYSNVGKVCEHRLSSVWAARIVRVYRFKGLA